MPTVKVSQTVNLDAQECFQRISELLETDAELRKLDKNYACKFDSRSLSGTASGSMFKADLKVTKTDSGSLVDIIVDLPFHLALAKGLVQKTLEKKISAILD